MAEFGVVPEALLADEGLARAVLPALRADFTIYEACVKDRKTTIATNEHIIS